MPEGPSLVRATNRVKCQQMFRHFFVLLLGMFWFIGGSVSDAASALLATSVVSLSGHSAVVGPETRVGGHHQVFRKFAGARTNR
jgi:hypothetical protein